MQLTGIAELGVPSIDPMHISELVMQNGQGLVNMKVTFLNLVAKGPSNYTVTNVRADQANLKFDLRMVLPKLEVEGQYDVVGNVFLLPIRSKGNIWALFGKIYFITLELVIPSRKCTGFAS